MLVRLEAAAFAHADNVLPLLGIFAVCERTGHGVRMEDDAAGRAFGRWLEALPRGLVEALRRIAESGEDTSRAAELEVIVDARRASHWRGRVPRLSATDALALLMQPLSVVLENGINDRNFLLAFASNSVRAHLEQAERSGRLRFVGPGGINELEKLVVAAGEGPIEALYRTFFLCDSDARTPGDLQQVAKDIETCLRVVEKERGMDEGWLGGALKARAGENYAPPARVVSWAIKSAADPDAQRFFSEINAGHTPGGRPWPEVAAAWSLTRLTWDIRAHLCLKYGRTKGKGGPIRTVDDIWSKIPADLQARLESGFGKDFSSRFYPTQRELVPETDELNRLLDTIRRRL